MLAKTIRNRAPESGRPQSFHDRVRYVCDKAAAIATSNLAGSWRDAAWQMQISAALNPNVRSAVYHLVVTWADTEQPSDPEMIDSARRAVYEIGGHDHQHVIGVHRDRRHRHAHVVLNRVHPITGKALSLSQDYMRLEKACRRIEFEMGWPPDRGRFDVAFYDGEVHLMPKPAAHWRQKRADRERGLRPDGRAVYGHERRTGLPALRDALSAGTLETIRRQLDLCAAWPEVHATLFAHRLRYILHRSGARIGRLAGTWAMAASSLGAAYCLARMVKRLGAFVPATAVDVTAVPRVAQSGRPEANANLSQFRKIGTEIRRRKRAQRKILEDHREDRNAIANHHAEERKEIRSLLQGKRDVASIAIRHVMGGLQHEARTVWARGSRPDYAAPDLVPLLAARAPDLLKSRRYRHVLRTWHDDPPEMARTNFDDHTARRQAWGLPPPTCHKDLPEGIGPILSLYPDDIRPDHDGRLLCARRNLAGSILGFDALDLAALMPVPARRPASRDGIGLLGPRDSATVIVVPDTLSAIIQMLVSEAPHPLILTVDASLDAAAEHLIRCIVGTRNCIIAMGQEPETADLRQRLRQFLPHATHRMRAPHELISVLPDIVAPSDMVSGEGFTPR